MGINHLIIGASAAGMACAHTLRTIDDKAIITVLSGESAQPYFRPMIPYIINGKKGPSEIALTGSGIFTSKGIDVRTDSAVTCVDTQLKSVTTKNRERFSYDKILFATGSSPHMPKSIEGLYSEGVYCLKTIKDAMAMAKRAETTDHAVMLGGGILNLKAAFALLEKNIQVTLVVHSPEILSQLMEPSDAGRIRNALKRAGLKIITGCSATAVVAGDDGAAGVVLDNGRELACRMVCVGKGVVPNTAFLDGTKVIVETGILGDNHTACSIKDAFTAGDVAVTLDPVSGEKTVTSLWTHAVEMGICAGRNMAGIKTRYAGTLGIMNATQVADEPFVAMGMVHTAKKNVEVFTEQAKDHYRKIVFNKEGNRLIGTLLMGDITNAGIYRYVIREKRDVSKIKSRLIDHSIHYGHFA